MHPNTTNHPDPRTLEDYLERGRRARAEALRGLLRRWRPALTRRSAAGREPCLGESFC